MDNLKHKQAYKLYTQGLNLSQIATTLGVSRQSVSNWKKRYKWDKELLLDATKKEELQAYEQRFIAGLIKEWEVAIDELQESDLPKKMEILEKYTRSYFKLKAGNFDTKIAKEKLTKEVAYKTIKAVADIAKKHNAIEAAEFLAKYADEIVDLIRGYLHD